MRHALALALLLFASTPALAQPFAVTPAVTIPGLSLTAYGQNGAPEAWESAYEQWGNGFGYAAVTFPYSGVYTFTISAAMKSGAAPGLSELRIDQLPVAVGAGWSQTIASAPQSTSAVVTYAPYTWSSFIKAGTHQVAVSLMNRDPSHAGSLIVSAITVTGAAPSTLPPEPPGSRDPGLQPYSSYSLWNTAIGSGAQWSAPGDPDTVDLRTPGGGINAGAWSIPIYQPAATDAPVRFADADNTYPLAALAPVYLPLPAGAAPSAPAAGGDHHMVVYAPSKATITHLFGCAQAGDGSYTCGQTQQDDVCGLGMGGYGWGAGVIRASELAAGSIPHMLRFALAPNRTKAGSSWLTGLAWPAMRSDYNGPLGLYTGNVLYGSTVGIPASVDVTTLGLTASGLALAHALQDYGALQRDTGGSGGILFYAEQAAEGMAQLTDMRADMAKIVPVLSVLRNQGPATINGGGAPRKPAQPGIDRSVCP